MDGRWTADGRRVALVTGAARGFGAGVVRGLVANGWAVLAADLPGPELVEAERELQQLVGSSSSSGSGQAFPCNVCEYDAVAAAVGAAVASWGRLDLIVANAAVLQPRLLADTSPQQWESALKVNLTGVWHAWRAAWPVLASQPGGGHLLAIASGASVRGGVGGGAYVAAKHALEGLVKSAAAEGLPHCITVNSIGPGCALAPTGATRAQLRGPGGLTSAELASQFPMGSSDKGKWVDPVTLAPAFAWLGSRPTSGADVLTGLRFDAAPLAATLRREGEGFTFAPEKACLTGYVADMRARLLVAGAGRARV